MEQANESDRVLYKEIIDDDNNDDDDDHEFDDDDEDVDDIDDNVDDHECDDDDDDTFYQSRLILPLPPSHPQLSLPPSL